MKRRNIVLVVVALLSGAAFANADLEKGFKSPPEGSSADDRLAHCEVGMHCIIVNLGLHFIRQSHNDKIALLEEHLEHLFCRRITGMRRVVRVS